MIDLLPLGHHPYLPIDWGDDLFNLHCVQHYTSLTIVVSENSQLFPPFVYFAHQL